MRANAERQATTQSAKPPPTEHSETIKKIPMCMRYGPVNER